jgi:hypothetical protein
VRTALLAAVVAVGLAACGDGPADAVAPGSVTGEGPARPAAGGSHLHVDPGLLQTPVVLDPVPEGLVVTGLSYEAPDDRRLPARATLYGDPDLADTLDGPVLLVGTSSGSASLAGPPQGTAGERAVDLGGRTGRVVRDTDRTWVLIDGNDEREFVVGRGIDEEELVAAARGADFRPATATLAEDVVPTGLVPLVAGNAPDRPGGDSGEHMSLQGDGSWISVSAVHADPRLAALWGFWVEDARGTVVRGRPGSAGDLQDADVGDPDARGRVWAEDGLVLSVVVTGARNRALDRDALLDRVVANLRVGTWAEFEALDGEIRTRPPTRGEAACGPDGWFVSGVEQTVRWSFQLRTGPWDWSVCYLDLTSGVGGGGSILPPPLGELAIPSRGSGIVGGVAPPGTARVTVTTPSGHTLEAQLSDAGPRPGERVWGAFVLEGLMAPSRPPFTVTAYDAAGAVLHSRAG